MTNRSQRKRAVWLITAMCASILLSSCSLFGSGSSQEGLKQYEGNGFTVSYPADWKSHPEGKIFQYADFEVVDLSSESQTPRASIHISVQRHSRSLRATVQYAVGTSYASLEDFTVLSRDKVRVDGQRAYELWTSYSSSDTSGSPLTLKQSDLFVLTSSNNKTLNVKLLCQADRCGRYQETFDAVLDSVRITG